MPSNSLPSALTAYVDGGRFSLKKPEYRHPPGAEPAQGGLGTAWQKLGLKHPKADLAANSSNIDDSVEDVIHELRAKGLNLK